MVFLRYFGAVILSITSYNLSKYCNITKADYTCMVVCVFNNSLAKTMSSLGVARDDKMFFL